MSYYGPVATVSNAESWYFDFQLIDNDNNPIGLAGYTIAASVEDEHRCERLYFSTDNNRVTVDGTTAKFVAEPDEMRKLRPGRYSFFLKVTKDGITSQITDSDCVLTIVGGGPK